MCVCVCLYVCACVLYHFITLSRCTLCFYNYLFYALISTLCPLVTFAVHLCTGVPFTNRTCLKSTLGFNVDCEVVICKGTYVCVPTVWHWCSNYCQLIMSVDSLAHASERELVFAMIVQAGRIGIMTNTMLLMEDIRLLSPTTFSTTPR